MIAKVNSVKSVETHVTLPRGEEPLSLTVKATGQVNSGGWSNPELGTWSYITAPEDGMLDLDFLASPPEQGTIVTPSLARISATISLPIPDWVTGVRVHGSTNFLEAKLEGLPADKTIKTEPSVPWPWPWFRDAGAS